jgi:hypothetical protein
MRTKYLTADAISKWSKCLQHLKIREKLNDPIDLSARLFSAQFVPAPTSSAKSVILSNTFAAALFAKMHKQKLFCPFPVLRTTLLSHRCAGRSTQNTILGRPVLPPW